MNRGRPGHKDGLLTRFKLLLQAKVALLAEQAAAERGHAFRGGLKI